MFEHVTEIHKTEAGARYPFVVVCSCAWQSFAPSEEIGERIALAHKHNRMALNATQGLQQGRL